MKRLVTTLMLSTALFATSAGADEPTQEGESKLLIPYGMSASIGGGVGGFLDEDMRDLTGTAGFWEARLMFGTRLPVGLELGYLGGLQTIDALGLDTDARLLTTGLEATARINFLQGNLQPYAFGGIGWSRFDLTNFDKNTSSVEDQDDALAVPVGLGVGYRYQAILGDLRATYRPMFYEDLVPATGADEHQNLDDWSITARVGFEF